MEIRQEDVDSGLVWQTHSAKAARDLINAGVLKAADEARVAYDDDGYRVGPHSDWCQCAKCLGYI